MVLALIFMTPGIQLPVPEIRWQIWSPFEFGYIESHTYVKIKKGVYLISMDVKIEIMSISIISYKFQICSECRDNHINKMHNGCQDKHNVNMNKHKQVQNIQRMSR